MASWLSSFDGEEHSILLQWLTAHREGESQMPQSESQVWRGNESHGGKTQSKPAKKQPAGQAYLSKSA